LSALYVGLSAPLAQRGAPIREVYVRSVIVVFIAGTAGVDTHFVGHLGAGALARPSLVFP
jgi:hypothetical protein